jgi:hypothetical protein
MTAQTHGAAIFMRAVVYLEALISGIDSTYCGITKRILSRNLLDPRTARVGTLNLRIGRNLKEMWTEVISTPEASTFAMLLIGLGLTLLLYFAKS